MPKYTYRPECSTDELRFLGLLLEKKVLNGIDARFMPADGYFASEIDVALPINEIVKLIDQLPDCHVIADTIELSKNYTGDRQYDMGHRHLSESEIDELREARRIRYNSSEAKVEREGMRKLALDWST